MARAFVLETPSSAILGGGRRWLALYLLCAGVLMIVLDSTIVYIAIPTITADLQLSTRSAIWLLNAYMLTFGGFLLLGGRLGDHYGRRKIFLLGLGLFTLASLACGVAYGPSALVAARAVQGLGGAVVTSVSLSLVVFLFQDPRERARAVGIYGLVCAAGGSLGEVLGGLLTQTLGWHWIFLVNLPIGIVVSALCWSILPLDEPARRERRVDYPGACCITAALTLFVYTFINAGSGWVSTQLAWLAAASVVLCLFVAVEKRARDPLVPRHLFRHNFAVATLLSALSTATSYAWFAIAALYFQRILGYDPIHVGLAFLPSTAVIAILSAGFSEPIVASFGTRRPICAGLLLTAVGLALLSRAPLTGRFLTDVLPGMLLVGLGAGISATPMILAATQDLPPTESGLASGVLNTAFVIGGTLGIAAILTLADLRTVALQQVGLSGLPALDGGYHLAFITLSFLASSASVLAAVLLKVRKTPS